MSKHEERPLPGPGEAAPEMRSIRSRINDVDEQLLDLLARRRELSQEVARAKGPAGAPIRDTHREEELLVRQIRAGRERGLDAHYVTRIYHEVMADSIRLQQAWFQRQSESHDGEPAVIRVAFQGIEGAYSHLAALDHFADRADRLAFVGLPAFSEVVEAVERGHADVAMLPIENTTSGGINEVYDLLLHTRLSIIGEEKFRVRHCLVAAEDVPLAGIKRIFSHPQAVAQCGEFLGGLAGCEVGYFTDTAMSVERIEREGDTTQAAIASEQAADQFGLHVIARDIANQRENYTRFLVAARSPRQVDRRLPCKTSLVMATGQQPGALVEALLVFRTRSITLTKLESRPMRGNPWEEMFYVDLLGNVDDPSLREALDELASVTRFIKVLGSYPSRDGDAALPTAEALAAGRDTTDDDATTPSGPVEKPAPRTSGGHKLVGREHKPQDTVIELRGVRIGGTGFTVIAGPCAVESAEQIRVCAREVREAGGAILRGGCFKPRTSTYSFQGLGWDGLELLVEAGRSYDLPVVTEVLASEDVQRVAQTADMLQIGARNMQNFTLLREVGRVNRPVFLKRGLMASIDELLHAAEYILAQGNQQVILCERGIRTFETATRNTLDLSSIPILRSRTHLPVFVDPSHAAGDRELVPPLARAARAVGAQGLMIEIHPQPEEALSDGPQALRFPEFESLMSELMRPGDAG